MFQLESVRNWIYKTFLGQEDMLAKLITQEMIEECQKLIDTSKESFFDDLDSIVEKLQRIAKNPQMSKETTKAMSHAAADIQSSAGLFGYDLIAALAGQLINLLDSKQFDAEKKQRLINKYVDALVMAVNKRINDNGGAVGDLILKDLAAFAKSMK